ncbi:MAG: phosphatase PAP2 family protein [Gaiella sp.]|nr:phosphatase PAP2 family protein [Gaiella sp.]
MPPTRPAPAGARPRWGLHAPTGLAREALLVAFAILLYFGIRNATVGNADVAFANADRLVTLERHLGIAWEDSLQSAIVSHDALVTAANWVYIWGHWPVILSVATLLYLYRPRQYYLLRNAFFVSGFIGFAFFWLFPVAPPRLLDAGLVDTVTEHSNAYRALQPPGLTNQYAAFPSLHAGWNVLVGIVLVVAVTSLALRLVAVALPVAMSLAVVATANHFVIDVAAGLVVVLIGLVVAIFVQRRETASTLGADGASGDRGDPGRGLAAVRRRASGREPPRQAA